MRLSPTAVLKYEICPQQYYLEEIRKIRPRHAPANLVFGRTLHAVIEHWLGQWLNGLSVHTDIRQLFDERWEQAMAAGGIEYSANQSPASLQATGRVLVEQFTQIWPAMDLMPVLDAQGGPLLERKLEVELAPGIVYVGKLDLLTLNSAGQVVCLDFKITSHATDPDWLMASDQLTGYQILLDEHADRLGIAPVERIGLLELIKRNVPKNRGKGPEVCPPKTVARRSRTDLDAYRRKVQWVAEDIQRGRFPKRGLMAHNSPCGLCSLRGFCHNGEVEGVVMPETESQIATT